MHFNDRFSVFEVVSVLNCFSGKFPGFAHEHKNPDKRRQVVWQLAREGCSREREYRYESRPPSAYDYER